ncbi:MAG: hypothetical protein KBA75_04495 [Alphaproteobacteria bacterium]|nr:hypothetical protein [Alphaproteobacteria bacterium]
MQHSETVENGATYMHQQGAMLERAHVLSVGNDCFGIPHVRYQLELKRGCNIPTIVQRTLALASFRARYRERMQAFSTQEG